MLLGGVVGSDAWKPAPDLEYLAELSRFDPIVDPPEYIPSIEVDYLNPLAGRVGFLGLNADFPGYTFDQIDLGPDYAGKTVQVRFRLGSDNLYATDGWAIKSVGFAGIKGTPFTSVTLDAGKCAQPTTSKSGGCSTGPGTLGFTTLLLAAAALALRLPRRRRALAK